MWVESFELIEAMCVEEEEVRLGFGREVRDLATESARPGPATRTII